MSTDDDILRVFDRTELTLPTGEWALLTPPPARWRMSFGPLSQGMTWFAVLTPPSRIHRFLQRVCFGINWERVS